MNPDHLLYSADIIWLPPCPGGVVEAVLDDASAIHAPTPPMLLAAQDPRLHAEASVTHIRAVIEALEAPPFNGDAVDHEAWFTSWASRRVTLPRVEAMSWPDLDVLMEYLDAVMVYRDEDYDRDDDLSLLTQDSTVLDQEATTTLLDLAEQGKETEFKDLARMLRGDVTDEEVNALWCGTRRRQGHAA